MLIYEHRDRITFMRVLQFHMSLECTQFYYHSNKEMCYVLNLTLKLRQKPLFLMGHFVTHCDVFALCTVLTKVHKTTPAVH